MSVKELDVNETWLKERLLNHIPELESYKKEIEVLLVFKAYAGPLLSESLEYKDAIIVSKAAQILRKQMQKRCSTFQGNFNDDYIKNCVPNQQIEFMVSLFKGADIRSIGKAAQTEIGLPHLL